jgi:hypothetical protein
MSKPRTLCSRGHPLDGVLASGRRYCTTCNRSRKRRIPAESGAVHADGCTGAVEPHVRYDLKTRCYTPELRCRCGAVARKGRSRFAAWRDAENAARMLATEGS